MKEEINKNTKKSIVSELSLYVEHLLEVEINKEEIGKISLFLEDKSNNFYAKKTDLEEWNFTCPKEAPVMHKGEPYYSLQAFKDLEYQFNPTRMSIHITVSPKHLQPQDIDFGEPSFVVPSDSPLGAYVNYNTDAQMEKSARQFGGVLGCGIFGKYGLLFNQALLQTTSNSLSNSSKFVRLNSSWRIDYPFEMQSLILGDSYTPTSLWGGCVGIGGIQWRKNFHTQPMFITFPTPSLEGEATIPSTIDLYVDNMKVGEKKKVSGPFSINSFPVITGEGNLRLVKTDLLGNQEEILVPYYASKKLLKPGLQNFSYSAGMIRHSFGIKQADYKNLVFAGNHEIGVTDNFTAEAHLEILPKYQTTGVGGTFLIGQLATLNLGAAGSMHQGKSGGLVMVGAHRRALDIVSLGASLQIMSKNFIQIGPIYEKHSSSYVLNSFIGINLFDGASLVANYTNHNRCRPKMSFLNVSYYHTICDGLTFTAQGSTNIGDPRNKSVYFILTYSLSSDTFLNVGGIVEKGSNQQTIEVQKNLPLGPGYGYTLYAGNGQQRNYKASLVGQNDEGKGSIGLSKRDKTASMGAQASGSIAFLDGNVYLSRDLGDGFAIVKTGYKDVEVFYQNQSMGFTNDDGTLLVPRILPYQNNPIRIQSKDLPFDAELVSDSANPIPYYGMGVVVSFPIKASYSAMLNLILPSGQPVPLDAIITFKNQIVPISENGEIYLTGLDSQNCVEVKYNNKNYNCFFDYKKTSDPLPHLGDILCGN